MWLYKLVLDVLHQRGRRDAADPYETHRTLASAAAADERAVPPRLLWRREPQTGRESPVLVLSPVEVDWERINERFPHYLLGLESRRVDFAKAATPGRELRFRLDANTAVCRDGKRIALTREEEQLEWLISRAASRGFEALSPARMETWRIASRKGGGPNRLTLAAARFEGVLRVTDGPAFQASLEGGLGRGKAFGLGLLTVGRV